MAKKSLKKRIDDITNALGGTKKPTLVEIRSELFSIGTLVEALEEGQAMAEKEAQIAVLEAALEKSNLENAELQAELQTANTGLDAFRAERKKQEEKKRRQDIPEIQFKILRRLPTENVGGGWLSIFNVSRSLKIPPEEVEIHLNGLQNAGLVTRREDGGMGQPVWHRSIKGSQLVLARRLAGEEETPVTQYADLPAIEEAILALILREGDGIEEQNIHEVLLDRRKYKRAKVTIEKVKWILKSLKAKGFADFDPEEETYGRSFTWFITDAGTEYFAERGEL
jgi:DNA-binding transcriptional ArsR family regulator